MSEPASIRVAIIEDNEGLRQTIEAILKRESGIECVGAFESAEDGLREIPGLKPAVVLMDIQLPGMNGVDCVRQLKPLLPELQIIMLTVHDHTKSVFESLEAGANGFLLKPVRAGELGRAIHEVHAGGAPMTPNIARQVVQTFQKPIPTPDPALELSPRERQVLELLAQGLLQKEIADQLAISYHTVQAYTARIYEKLQVRSRSQAVAKYLGTMR
ncbi:MAG: response regulator transcription factor [Verrucomicrobiota bacterium]